jgi:predicted DNA-binding mobile mystery protein A
MARTVGTAKGRQAARRALDRRGDDLRKLAMHAATPRGGWIRALREALGMSASELGERLSVTQTSVLRMEESEKAGRIRLDTLARAADALDCEFVYALVPRQSLQQTVDDQARRLAVEIISRVDHSMRLEDQRVSSDVGRDQLDALTEQLRDRPGLWRRG